MAQPELMFIERDGIYYDVRLLRYGFSMDALTRARRSGALRHARVGRGGRSLYLGAWILDWMDAVATGGRPAPSDPAGDV